LSPDAQGLQKQLTLLGGGIYCAGAGSTITGFRADGVFSDDLITGMEQASSLAQLDKLWNWYISEARSRLKPSTETGQAREGLEGQIATRWHMQDPIGRVVRLTQDSQEDWKYIRIPMLADEEPDPVGRKLGERLWKEYFTERMVKDAQRSPLIFTTLYQQRPATSEHTWCPPEHLTIVDRVSVPENCRTYIGCDVAQSDMKGDFTVFVVIKVDAQGYWWVVDLLRMRTEETVEQFLALCVQYSDPVHRLTYCWVEDDNPSKIWFRMVNTRAAQLKINAPLLKSKIKNVEKEVRAAPLRSLFMRDLVRIVKGDWNQALLLEIAEFPGGRHDDMIDAIGVVAKELHKNIGPMPVADKNEPKVIEGSFKVVEGKTVTRSTVDQLFKLNAGRRRRRRI
jgi:phage terminase large subunit-like protein